MSSLENLIAKARAATPGEWVVRSMKGQTSFVQAPRIDPAHPYDIEVLGEDDTLYPTREADLAFIAACCPAKLLPLLEEIVHLRDLQWRMEGLQK